MAEDCFGSDLVARSFCWRGAGGGAAGGRTEEALSANADFRQHSTLAGREMAAKRLAVGEGIFYAPLDYVWICGAFCGGFDRLFW